jgi:hypothetical protein
MKVLQLNAHTFIDLDKVDGARLNTFVAGKVDHYQIVYFVNGLEVGGDWVTDKNDVQKKYDDLLASFEARVFINKEWELT